jgi:HTH-type transcriptional regulator/antitoxin HigA
VHESIPGFTQKEMTIRPIRINSDHEGALKRIQALMSSKPGTDEGDELDVLATLVDAYEVKHFPVESPDPIEATRFRMEQMGLKRKDLEPLIGSRARVSEVLNKRRGLSLKMIRALHEELDIPLEALIGREG